MSEKKHQFNFRIPPDLLEFLEQYALSKNTSKSDAVIDILKMAMQTDIFKKMADTTNRFENLDKDKCPALVHIEAGFICFINAPTQKPLGNGEIGDASKLCKSCNEVKHTKDKIIELQKQLDQTIKLQIPRCRAGAQIYNLDKPINQQYFANCPYNKGKQVSLTQCKTPNCKELTYIEIETGKKTKDER